MRMMQTGDLSRYGTELHLEEVDLGNQNTIKATKSNVKAFQEWQMVVHKDTTPIEDLHVRLLGQRLATFIVQVITVLFVLNI